MNPDKKCLYRTAIYVPTGQFVAVEYLGDFMYYITFINGTKKFAHENDLKDFVL